MNSLRDSGERSTARGISPRVLIIGNSPDATEPLCRSLSADSFQCTPVHASGAFAAATSRSFDAAVVAADGTSPRAALALARQLRTRLSDLGLVLLADSRSLGDVAEALQIGVVDYLTHPFSHAQIVSAVRNALEWRQDVLQSISIGEGSCERRANELAQTLASILTAPRTGSTARLNRCLRKLYGDDASLVGHVRRVATTAVSMARSLSIGEPLLGTIERAALLHDVGRLAIPAEVWSKKQPLTREEAVLLGAHVEIGAMALSDLPSLMEEAVIVGAIRERYDGLGALTGSGGNAIPIGARIIAVAESFDCLNWNGSSREFPTAVAAGAIVRESGRRFDPRAVRALMHALDGGDGRVAEEPVNGRTRCS